MSTASADASRMAHPSSFAARVHYVEGDSVTMTMIKTELERVLTRMSLDPYAVLGVASDVADAAAKKAYRKLILK